ncbi:unnamed protein product [Calicophoron daubneyi]|uniref:Uncharacterized protein n=1 Tax=Calicophoron daubneyi TaxID=300641 RepID=A0AAV2T974_CALDB
MVSHDLARHLSWQKTPNRLSFGTTALWAVIFETLAANSSDPEANAVAIRKICLGWFQNARDKSGGRSKRRYTCPKMPLLGPNKENVSLGVENDEMSTSFAQL